MDKNKILGQKSLLTRCIPKAIIQFHDISTILLPVCALTLQAIASLPTPPHPTRLPPTQNVSFQILRFISR